MPDGDPLSVGDQPDGRRARHRSAPPHRAREDTARGGPTAIPGAEIEDAPRYFVGAPTAAVETYDPTRLEVKLDAGAGFVMTQIAYDLDRLSAWADVVRPRGVLERAAVFVGVALSGA